MYRAVVFDEMCKQQIGIPFYGDFLLFSVRCIFLIDFIHQFGHILIGKMISENIFILKERRRKHHAQITAITFHRAMMQLTAVYDNEIVFFHR